MDNKNRKITIHQTGKEEKGSSDHVKAEEVNIHVKGQGQEQRYQPFNRSFQFRTTGCMGTLLGLVAAVLMFVVFLPLGIAALTGAAAYLGWKFRHLLWRSRR